MLPQPCNQGSLRKQFSEQIWHHRSSLSQEGTLEGTVGLLPTTFCHRQVTTSGATLAQWYRILLLRWFWSCPRTVSLLGDVRNWLRETWKRKLKQETWQQGIIGTSFFLGYGDKVVLGGACCTTTCMHEHENIPQQTVLLLLCGDAKFEVKRFSSRRSPDRIRSSSGRTDTGTNVL